MYINLIYQSRGMYVDLNLPILQFIEPAVGGVFNPGQISMEES